MSRWPHCPDDAPSVVATVVSSMVILPDGRSKHKDAEKHGVRVQTEDEWLALIGG
jgi:hypothetical protein